MDVATEQQQNYIELKEFVQAHQLLAERTTRVEERLTALADSVREDIQQTRENGLSLTSLGSDVRSIRECLVDWDKTLTSIQAAVGLINSTIQQHEVRINSLEEWRKNAFYVLTVGVAIGVLAIGGLGALWFTGHLVYRP